MWFTGKEPLQGGHTHGTYVISFMNFMSYVIIHWTLRSCNDPEKYFSGEKTRLGPEQQRASDRYLQICLIWKSDGRKKVPDSVRLRRKFAIPVSM